MAVVELAGRLIGDGHVPFVIVEIGINHEGDMNKARQMIRDAHAAGAECVKFQCHVVEDEMIRNSVVPPNSKDTIWDIMSRCALSEAQERELKAYVEELGMIYLSTPFSRAAADRLERMAVQAFKVGSGECNNYPLVEHLALFRKPLIISTGMNSVESVRRTVEICEKHRVPYALLHCTSMYPTPYSKVRLGAIEQLRRGFPNAVIGLSDHSYGNFTAYAAVALGACIVEKHFTSDRNWKGPDVPFSIEPWQLEELVRGTKAVFEALGGTKDVLVEEQPTIRFAYASVVSIKDICRGEQLSRDNIWVKRPGAGGILAKDYESLLGRAAEQSIPKDTQLTWSMIRESE